MEFKNRIEDIIKLILKNRFEEYNENNFCICLSKKKFYNKGSNNRN